MPAHPDDTPDHRAARDSGAMDAVAALNPYDAFEARVAARIVAMDSHAADCLRLAGLAAADPAEMRRCRARGRHRVAPVGRGVARAAAAHAGEAALHPTAMARRTSGRQPRPHARHPGEASQPRQHHHRQPR